MAEISEISALDRTIDIVHPGTKEPLGIKVGVMHIDDDRLKRLKRRITDERLRLQTRGKTFKAEELEENTNNLLFNAMTYWDWGSNTFHGEIPEFNKRNVIAVLDEKPWFADQIKEAIEETEAFFGNSKST